MPVSFYTVVMNKKFLPILMCSALAAVASQPICLGMPAVSLDYCTGVISSPLAQLPNVDPQLEQTINVLKSREHLQNDQKKLPVNSETTISRRHTKSADGVLILGGPESIPM